MEAAYQLPLWFQSMKSSVRRRKSHIRLDSHPRPHEILPHQTEQHMWPVMTLTLLLQLTDDEQLYAQQEEGDEVKTEAQAPVAQNEQASTAEWSAETEAIG